MAQGRSSRRGVTNIVTCAVLLLFGLLGTTAACSSIDGSSPEQVGSQSEAAGLCDCPANNPCATFTCVGTLCKATPVIKEGELCTGKGDPFTAVCHLNLCCPGCVVAPGHGAAQFCAKGDGAEDPQCGVTGKTCENCNADPCQAGQCSRQTCELKPVGDGDACLNTPGGCYKGVCCKGCLDANGVCQPGGALDNCGVSIGKLAQCADCTDKVVCTAEACVSGSCQYPAVDPGTSCSNGNKCDGEEGCSGTQCAPGTPLKCDDGEACTLDKCDGTDGCTHTALTGQDCSDGDPCTTDDKCGADGTCKPGTQINCDDSEFCTSDSCQGGKCVNKAVTEGTGCDDKDACTTADKCTAGQCKGTSANGVDCNDNKTCTVDAQAACNSQVCNHTPASVNTSCISDKCHGAGHCSGNDDTCVAGDPIDCDDSNPCTVDGCSPTTGCTHTNNAAADCSDGDACTENDVCVAGNCGGKPKKCLALDACHEPGTCDAVSGTCDDPRAADNKPCPGGACQGGKCILDPNAGLGGDGAGGGSAAGAAAGGDSGTIIATGGEGTTPSGQAGESTKPGDGGNGPGGVDDPLEEPERPFVRTPGGCSCELPNHGRSGAVWLVALAFLAGRARRRSRLGRLAA